MTAGIESDTHIFVSFDDDVVVLFGSDCRVSVVPDMCVSDTQNKNVFTCVVSCFVVVRSHVTERVIVTQTATASV